MLRIVGGAADAAGFNDRHAVIDLTTVGRVSGRPHTIEIWFAQPKATIYMLSGGGDRSDRVGHLFRTREVRVSADNPPFRNTPVLPVSVELSQCVASSRRVSCRVVPTN